MTASELQIKSLELYKLLIYPQGNYERRLIKVWFQKFEAPNFFQCIERTSGICKMAIGSTTKGDLGPFQLRQALDSIFQHRDHYKAVFSGLLKYWRTGQTPEAAYQSLIALFCATGGISNDMLSQLLRLLHKPYRIDNTDGILKLASLEARSTAISTLRNKGYYVFPERLPAAMCDELTSIALTEDCVSYDQNQQKKIGRYDRNAPDFVKYAIPTETLIRYPIVQKFISDFSILWLAQEYLEAKPILDIVTMWWSTSINNVPDSQAAQLYHFDMDRIRFLKFFVYLTDVGTDNGPHCFVQNSHRTGGIPQSILKHGYSRIEDQDIQFCYPSEDLVEIHGLRGTIFAEDTRGMHKGKRVEKGDRLVFELEFSNSLFGGSTNGPALPKTKLPELATAVSRWPRVYSHFK